MLAFQNEIVVKGTKYLQFPTSVSDFCPRDATVQDRRCCLTFIWPWEDGQKGDWCRITPLANLTCQIFGKKGNLNLKRIAAELFSKLYQFSLHKSNVYEGKLDIFGDFGVFNFMCSVNHENGRYPNFLLTANPTRTKLECKVFLYSVFSDGEGIQHVNGHFVRQVLSIVQLFANYYDYVRRKPSKTLLPHINFVSAKSLQKKWQGKNLPWSLVIGLQKEERI